MTDVFVFMHFERLALCEGWELSLKRLLLANRRFGLIVFLFVFQRDIFSRLVFVMALNPYVGTGMCAKARANELDHVPKNSRKRLKEMNLECKDHYLLGYAAAANCLTCTQHWVSIGADLSKGTINHDDWAAEEFARYSSATSTLSFLEGKRFELQAKTVRRCRGAQQDELFHVLADPSRDNIGAIPDITWKEHYLFLWACSADCVDCVEYWIRNGADLRKGTGNHPGRNARYYAQQGEAVRTLAFLEECMKLQDAEVEPETMDGIWSENRASARSAAS